MEVKKNLNNVQRKMLDEIYTEQFTKRERAIRDERETGLKKLQVKLLANLSKDKEVKKMLEAGKAFYQAQEKLRSTLGSQNVALTYTLSGEPNLQVSYRYGGVGQDFPEVEEYNTRTREIELNLAEKKKEMRAKIYGVSASYEEVDKEIKELLKDI